MIKPSQLDKTECVLVYYQNHIRCYFKTKDAKYPDYYPFSKNMGTAYSSSVFTEPAMFSVLKLNEGDEVFKLDTHGISATDLTNHINLSEIRNKYSENCRRRMRFRLYSSDYFLEHFGAWMPY